VPQGSTTIDFGAFPGSVDASVAITGQTGIQSTSLVEAWIMPVATTDHSVAEHYVSPPRIMAGEIVAGTGFTIRGFATDAVGDWPLCYGLYTVAWAWN
jgi:hypothetical protein